MLRNDRIRTRRVEPEQRDPDMANPARTKAEEKFAAAQKRYKEVQKERDKEQQKQADQMAKLRALRLAKEAADKEAAEKAAAEKAAAKRGTAKEKKPAPLPALQLML